MITAVHAQDARQRFEAALEGLSDPTACVLGSRLEAFSEASGSSWHFYTGGEEEPPFALAVRGSSAWLAGPARPDELALLLRFLGVTVLNTAADSIPPTGWKPDRQMQVYTLAPGSCLTEVSCPEGFLTDRQPGLWGVAELIASQPDFISGGEEVRDNFYADSCALVNRGLARIWAGRMEGQLVVTAGAYALWKNCACLAAVYTKPEYRRRQLGRYLTSQLCNCLSGEGFAVTLECEPGKERFYEAMGFVRSGWTQRLCPPEE